MSPTFFVRSPCPRDMANSCHENSRGKSLLANVNAAFLGAALDAAEVAFRNSDRFITISEEASSLTVCKN